MQTARGLAIDAIEAAQDNLMVAKDAGQVSVDQYARVLDILLSAKVDLICRDN